MDSRIVFIFACFSLFANGLSINNKNIELQNESLKIKRDVFSYFWMTEEAKYKLFVQSLLDEFERKLNEERERELEKKREIERKIYKERLSARVSGNVLKDFWTTRY